MIAIAWGDPVFDRAEDARDLRTGSLRPISEILGQVLAGYALHEAEVHGPELQAAFAGQVSGGLAPTGPVPSLPPADSVVAEAIAI